MTLLVAQSAIAQDERFFRKLFSGDLLRKEEKKFKGEVDFRVASPFYKVDINTDGRVESLVTEKRDGQDWIHVHDFQNKRVFSGELEPMGMNSWLYKVSLRRIASGAKVLILHFYEGETEYLEFRANVRLYFLTIEKDDLSTFSLSKGPVVWDEHESFKGRHYHQRRYEIGLQDFNKDGIKEISVKYHLISWIYFYKSPGKWIEL